MLSEQRAGVGWFRRAFHRGSNPKPQPDAPYLDQLLWAQEEYARSARLGVAALVLLAVAVAIGTLGWIVFVAVLVVGSGTWVLGSVRLRRRIERERREPRDGYPTVAGS